MRNFTTHKIPTLFHKAILESGGPLARLVLPYNNTLYETQFEEFMELTNASAVPEELRMGYLRSLSVKAIKKASETVYNKYNPTLRWPFQPVIDGDGGMIPVAPIEIIRNGSWNSMPMIIGYNTDEGTTFVPHSIDDPKEFTEVFTNLLPQFSKSDLDKLQEMYPDPGTNEKSPYYRKLDGTGSQFLRLAAAYGQFAYIAPVRLFAKLAHNQANLNPRQIYYYEFNVKQSVIGGSSHGAQEDYITYQPSVVNGNPQTKELAGFVHAYWTSFIVTGTEKPSPDKLKDGTDHWTDRRSWGEYGYKGSSAKMIFGSGNDLRAGGHESGFPAMQTADKWALKECTFWWNRIDLFQGYDPRKSVEKD